MYKSAYNSDYKLFVIPLYHNQFVDSIEKGYTSDHKKTFNNSAMTFLTKILKCAIYTINGYEVGVYVSNGRFNYYEIEKSSLGMLASRIETSRVEKGLPKEYARTYHPNRLISCYEYGQNEISILPQNECAFHVHRVRIKKATKNKQGICTYLCKKCKKVFYRESIPAAREIGFAKKQYVYTGKAITPTLKTLGNLDPRLHKVKKDKKRKKVGKYPVDIKLDSRYYSCKLKKAITVIPRSATKIKVSRKGKKKVIVWNKVSHASGYQLSFTKTKDEKSKQIKKVKGNRKMYGGTAKYVRIRTYQVVKHRRIYSLWSIAKEI